MEGVLFNHIEYWKLIWEIQRTTITHAMHIFGKCNYLIRKILKSVLRDSNKIHLLLINNSNKGSMSCFSDSLQEIQAHQAQNWLLEDEIKYLFPRRAIIW